MSLETQLKAASVGAVAAIKAAEPSADTKPAAARKPKAKSPTPTLTELENALKAGGIVSMERVAKKAPAKKAPAKKAKKAGAAKAAPAKEAPAKKAAAPAKKVAAPKSIQEDTVLHRTDVICEMQGKRAATIKLLKDGTTWGDFRATVAKKFANDPTWNGGRTLVCVKAAIAAKMITVKE